MALQVSGKTAIVTGAGSGINLAFAKLLLENNCNVVFADLALRPEAQILVDQYTSSENSNGKPRAVFQKTDVTDWAQLEAMFATAESNFGRADIICPGAGVYEPAFSNFWIPPGSGTGDKKSADTPHGSRYAAMDINVTHPIRTTQMAIAHFTKHKTPGVVVHISSIAAQRPFLSCPLYVAAKSAISNFVRCLAELETPPAATGLPAIRVNAVAPGVIKTPLWTENPEKLAWVDTERDEWVTAEYVAEVMLQLVQDPKHVGGTVLEVGKDQVRNVEVFNDPGPSGAGHTVSQAGQGYVETWGRLSQPGWGL
ncbi:putative short chain dehydrogenase/ reductase [Microdochium bolleyi]|uniref:Putative short chain dehydrogenase/ reductase n=1 Tax=Microdochium bolleyi TaxID=196109 RepID=A0A136IQP7_9PEZI|nr:putative short chain dehydrogenase/ reductase [Microdochium bolleyi]